jgi:RNA polymerase sigma-70 factor (ECF subfamily)
MTRNWEDLYQAHSLELLRYLTKLTGDREEATDLMQDTFVRAITAPIDDPTAIRSWLFRVATNAAMSRFRRRRVLAFLPFRGTEVAVSSAFDVEAHHVRLALASIPSREAAALLLHYESGFSRAEIARMQGLSEEGVKSRLARGRKNFIAAYRRLQRGYRR